MHDTQRKMKTEINEVWLQVFYTSFIMYVKLVHILEWCYCNDNPVLHPLNGKWINHFHILIGSDYDLKGQIFCKTLGIQKLEHISHMRRLVNICVFPIVEIKEGTETNSILVIRNWDMGHLFSKWFFVTQLSMFIYLYWNIIILKLKNKTNVHHFIL